MRLEPPIQTREGSESLVHTQSRLRGRSVGVYPPATVFLRLLPSLRHPLHHATTAAASLSGTLGVATGWAMAEQL